MIFKTGRLFLALVLFSAADKSDPVRLVVLHTNDLHGHISTDSAKRAGAARIAALFKQKRQDHNRVLVLDAGDCVQGTPVSSFFQGKPIFEVMSAMGYDAMTLGNHEFDYGWQMIANYKELANFPLLCANAFDPEGELIADQDSLILDVDGIKVGLIPVLADWTPNICAVKHTRGCRFDSHLETAKKLYHKIRQQSDVVIALTHLGYEEDVKLAKQLPELDVIIGGHSNTLTMEPKWVGDVAVVQAYQYGSYVGQLDISIDLDQKKILKIEGRMIPAHQMPPPDPKVKALVDQWETKVSDKVDHVIGHNRKFRDRAELQLFVAQAFQESLGADLGHYNLGGIRDVLLPGEITARQMWQILPFTNTVVLCQMSGTMIKQVFGDFYRRMYRRIHKKKEYTVAMNSYVYGQLKERLGDKLVVIKQGSRLSVEVMIEHIKKHQPFE